MIVITQEKSTRIETVQAPHWHGKTVEISRLGRLGSAQRTDVIALLPAQMISVDRYAR
jgi:hypothetical protein